MSMNDLKIFDSPEFGEVRTMEIDGKAYFVANDVARALGYGYPKDAISRHCKGAMNQRYLTRGGVQEVKVIPEGDIYRLVIRSNLEGAERFESWIFDEVIPSIRETGGYQLPQTYAEALRALADKAEQNEKLAARIETMRPKEIFADAVAASKTSILIGELAKLITQNGYEIGQTRLFKWMREHGYLIKDGSSKNMPMQRYVQQGLFEIKESNVQNPDGSVRITKTTKVTGKGQQYFINKFLSVPFPE